MINCPICNVINEDSARFCAECGQRLQGSEPSKVEERQPESIQAVEVSPPQTEVGNQIPSQPSQAESSNVYQSDNSQPDSSSSVPKVGRKLHSPLLQPDYGYDEEPPEPKHPHESKLPPRSGKTLRSPMLGGGAVDDYDDVDTYTAPKQGKGLRSPLLRGQEIENPPYPPTPQHAAGRPGHLHSPLLDTGFEEYDDFIDDFETVDDPNVLRSPLLAAKVPMPNPTDQKADQKAEQKPEEKSEPKVEETTAKVEVAPKAEPVVIPPVTPEPPKIISAAASTFPSAGVGPIPHPVKTGISGGMKSPLLDQPEPYVPNRQASFSGSNQYESRYESDGLSSIIRMFVWPLGLSAAVRIWLVAEYARAGQLSPAVIASEFTHLIVIAFLMLLAVNYQGIGKAGGR